MPGSDLSAHVSTKDQQKLTRLEGLYVSGGSEAHQSDVQVLLEVRSSSR